MAINKILFSLGVALTLSLPALADEIVVNYNRPKEYVVGGVRVEGNKSFDSRQILQVVALKEGSRVKVPSDDISNIVKRLYMQKKFDDVSMSIERLSENGDTAYFKVSVIERPRVSEYTFTGVRKGEQKDLEERLKLRKGGSFSDYTSKTSCDIISRFYKEKGFQEVSVEAQVQKDTIIRGGIRVNFVVDRQKKVKVQKINFNGLTSVKESKVVKGMKKIKDKRFQNFFKSKKFDEKEYDNDIKEIVNVLNEAGFRDAAVVADTMYYIEPYRLQIDYDIVEGQRYYFRDISFTGNSVYDSETLKSILQIGKGDVYDVVTMEKRIYGGGKQTDYDISKLYRDNGYLFFNIQPVEVAVAGDSVDVEIRIVEGKPAKLNNVIINGNDLTSERVVRRQIFTRPGYLFSQTDFERSIREIASMGQFDAESIMDPAKGYSLLPNQADNTVDVVYNLVEKPSSTLEVSGGWGGSTFVATLGVSFNNFSTRRMFDKGAWRPVPLGDAQNLAIRYQTNGTYYTSFSASFSEPWLFGKKPNALSVAAYYSKQTNSYITSYYSILNDDEYMEVFGFSAGLGKRLKWPDNYFTLYNSLSWQTYSLKDWSYFIFDTGISHNLSYTLAIQRNSTDQQIYPRTGSELNFSLQLTPPYSLLRKYDHGLGTKVDNPLDIDYDLQTSQQRFKWIEYHKWTFKYANYTKLVGDLVLMARAQFGYLGYYNRNWGYSPFEGYRVGGDGMSGYSSYGTDVISLRGYSNYSLTPTATTAYSSGEVYAGNVYDKFTIELRYPLILQPQSTIFALLFLEGGNCWSDIKYFNPFQIKRSAGVGVRVFLPMVGLLGVDWGYGFDDSTNGKSQFHFVIGQQF